MGSNKLHVQSVYRFAPKPSTVCILHKVVMFVKATAVLSDDSKPNTVTHIAKLIV